MPSQLSQFDAYCRAVQKDNPVGFWPLCEPAGMSSPFAMDRRLSTSLIPGTYTGGYTLGQPGPFAGTRAVRFDGSSGYIVLGTPVALKQLTRGFSLSAWVLPTDVTAPRGIIANGAGSWYLRVYNGRLDFLASQSADLASSTTAVSPNVWSYVQVTVSVGATATIRFFINGVPAGIATTTSALSGSYAATIGADNGGGEFFSGSLAMVSVGPANPSVYMGVPIRRRTYSYGSLIRFRRSLGVRTGSRSAA